MTTLRCSAQLLRRLGPLRGAEVPASGQLGDWYARIVATRPRHLVLCTNECSLLCVVIPLAPQHQLLDRFVEAAQHRINQIAAPADARMKERAALADVHLGRATNRSVIGSMNEFTYAIDAWFAHRAGDDLEALGLWLCDTPCSPLPTTWPWREAELLLTGDSGISLTRNT
jgi:hypothetical protein